MLTLENATLIKSRANAAIRNLNAIVADLSDRVCDDDMSMIRKMVGSSIGIIITQILEPIFLQYPEIDDDI